MLKISDSITTDEGLIALLKGVPNLESLVFGQYMNDKMVEDSVVEVENDSDKDDENDSDDSEIDGDNDNEDDAANSIEGEDNHHNKHEGAGDGDDDNEDDDADFVEGENNHNNEDDGDVTDDAECESNDEYVDNYDNADDSWALDSATTGCLFPHLKSVCFQLFVGIQGR